MRGMSEGDLTSQKMRGMQSSIKLREGQGKRKEAADGVDGESGSCSVSMSVESRGKWKAWLII